MHSEICGCTTQSKDTSSNKAIIGMGLYELLGRMKSSTYVLELIISHNKQLIQEHNGYHKS